MRQKFTTQKLLQLLRFRFHFFQKSRFGLKHNNRARRYTLTDAQGAREKRNVARAHVINAAPPPELASDNTQTTRQTAAAQRFVPKPKKIKTETNKNQKKLQR